MKVISKVDVDGVKDAPPGDNLSYQKTGVGQIVPWRYYSRTLGDQIQ